MTESEFLNLADATLEQIQDLFDAANDSDRLDVECKRSGNVLEIEFIDNGSKMIVNSQAPKQEMWVAAKSGGFHLRYDGQRWHDTRSGEELVALLNRLSGEQGGASLTASA